MALKYVQEGWIIGGFHINVVPHPKGQFRPSQVSVAGSRGGFPKLLEERDRIVLYHSAIACPILIIFDWKVEEGQLSEVLADFSLSSASAALIASLAEES